LKNCQQKETTAKMKFKTVEVYWNMMTEVITIVASALSKVDDDMKENIKKEVFQELNQKFPNGNLLMDSSALIIYGEK